MSTKGPEVATQNLEKSHMFNPHRNSVKTNQPSSLIAKMAANDCLKTVLQRSQHKRASLQKSQSLAFSNQTSMILQPVLTDKDIWDDNEVVSSESDGDKGIREKLSNSPHHNFNCQPIKKLGLNVYEIKEEDKNVETSSI